MNGSPLSNPTWATQAADFIVDVVAKVRDRTTKPLIYVARGLVFGLIAVFGGLTALVLSLIVFTRGLQAILEWPLDHPTAVWVSYLVLGGVFLLAGSIAMAKRQSSSEAA